MRFPTRPRSIVLRASVVALVGLVVVELLASPPARAQEAASESQQRARNQRKRAQANETALHEREFLSPQVKIQMDCRRDETTIKADFSRPFSGILGVGNPVKTSCKVTGTGAKYYELHIPHNATESCEARWDNSTSSIANTLFIRFHQSLETGTDIAKNVLCRLTVGNVLVGKKPSPLKKSTRSLNSRIIRAQ